MCFFVYTTQNLTLGISIAFNCLFGHAVQVLHVKVLGCFFFLALGSQHRTTLYKLGNSAINELNSQFLKML